MVMSAKLVEWKDDALIELLRKSIFTNNPVMGGAY